MCVVRLIHSQFNYSKFVAFLLLLQVPIGRYYSTLSRTLHVTNVVRSLGHVSPTTAQHVLDDLPVHVLNGDATFKYVWNGQQGEVR